MVVTDWGKPSKNPTDFSKPSKVSTNFSKPSKISTDFSEPSKVSVDWSRQQILVRYEANQLPADASPAWERVGSFTTEEINPPGILRILTSVEDQGYYWRDDPAFNNIIGAVIEIKMKIIPTADTRTVTLFFGDGTYQMMIYFGDDSVLIDPDYISDEPKEYSIDTTDDYHIYRVTLKGTTVKLYIDGVLRLVGMANRSTSSKFVSFGDFATSLYASSYRCDYVRYSGPGKVSTDFAEPGRVSTDFARPSKELTGYVGKEVIPGSEDDRLLYNSHTLYDANVLYNGVAYRKVGASWSEPSNVITDWEE